MLVLAFCLGGLVGSLTVYFYEQRVIREMYTKGAAEFAEMRETLELIVRTYPQREMMAPHIKRAKEILDDLP